jgi:D-alanyl-D-alanine carboxypeptidase (penicillin-binding protein 5/6)
MLYLPRNPLLRVAMTLPAISLLSGCFEQNGGRASSGEISEPVLAGQQGSRVGSYVVVDFYSKKILSSHQPNTRRQVASLTKIATAMVTLDWAERTGSSLNQKATVPPSAAQIGGANPMGMQPGDQISLREALYASIIGSDNVAAHTLAAHVGRDLLSRSGLRENSVATFVNQMNSLANNLGVTNTKFTNAHGMDHQGETPYSTAADIARLAIYAMGKASFRFYASQKKRKISYSRGGQARAFLMTNTNKLLGVDSIDGVKTGMTRKAGPCLVSSAARPNSILNQEDGRTRVVPHRLVVVVLSADDRFKSSRSLMIRGWQKYDQWAASGRQILSPDELLSSGE